MGDRSEQGQPVLTAAGGGAADATQGDTAGLPPETGRTGAENSPG